MSGVNRSLRDQEALRQMVDAAQLIEEFCREHTVVTFKNDTRTWSATQYQILVIGEATAQRLSQQFIAAHPEIPWRQMKRMRDVLAHHYDTIDLDIIWETATRDIPDIRRVLQALLSSLTNTDQVVPDAPSA